MNSWKGKVFQIRVSIPTDTKQRNRKQIEKMIELGLECQGGKAFIFNLLGYGKPLKAYRRIKTVVLQSQYKTVAYELALANTNQNTTTVVFQAIKK